MKKIIVAFDGLKYSEAAAAYAIDLAMQMKAHLVGVFLDDFSYHSYKIYDLVQHEEGVSEERIERFENEDKSAREKSAELFELACRNAGINHSIHHDRNIAIHEILHESIYADLIIVDGKETLTHYEENKPTRFVRDLLI
ncbi:MAG TPA: universal stress protein, partial [Puia sp.]|nr:universal stress protein [Puia sp.]